MNATVIGPIALSRNIGPFVVTLHGVDPVGEGRRRARRDVDGVSFIESGRSIPNRARIVGAMSVRVMNPSRRVVGDVAQPTVDPRAAHPEHRQLLGGQRAHRGRRPSRGPRPRSIDSISPPNSASLCSSARSNWASAWAGSALRPGLLGPLQIGHLDQHHVGARSTTPRRWTRRRRRIEADAERATHRRGHEQRGRDVPGRHLAGASARRERRPGAGCPGHRAHRRCPPRPWTGRCPRASTPSAPGSVP